MLTTWSAQRKPPAVKASAKLKASAGAQGEVKETAALHRHHPARKRGRLFWRCKDLCSTAGGTRECDAISVKMHASGSTREQTLTSAAKIQMRILR